MSSHPVDVIQPHVETLLPALLTCARDNFYKVTSEALSALQVLVRVVRSSDVSFKEHPAAAGIATMIYPVVLHRLRATDIDQEVKENAITTMATLLAHLGTYLQSEWPTCIPIFLERLKNEITRLTAVKALNLMASSQIVDLDLRVVLGDAIPVLASFLRKNQRALKLATLSLLDTLVKRYTTLQPTSVTSQTDNIYHLINLSFFNKSFFRYGVMDPNLLECVINELPPLLSEGDLHCAQQALQLMTSLAVYQPQSLERTANVCMGSIKILVRSPLMQGTIKLTNAFP